MGINDVMAGLVQEKKEKKEKKDKKEKQEKEKKEKQNKKEKKEKKEHKRMGRPPSGVPEHIKKFRATEEEWKEFLELCPDDSREAFLFIFNALKEAQKK